MIYLHETHEISAGRIVEFEKSLRDVWKPLVERPGEARLLWVWEHTHGTGPSYQVISIVALRDWQVYGELVRRAKERGDLHDWYREICSSRREVTGKILVPTPWSPLQETKLDPTPAADHAPAMYLHDTGWPFPGKLDEYMEALGTIFFPAVGPSGMISIEACWSIAPGTGRFHEVVLLQKILDWNRFSMLLTHGEPRDRKIPWMAEGLRVRDRWESKLLRTLSWSSIA
jgi:hypothetical protein